MHTAPLKLTVEVEMVLKTIRYEPGENKDKPWALYTRDGKKLLGRHTTREGALAQERAIHAQQRKGEGDVRDARAVADGIEPVSGDGTRLERVLRRARLAGLSEEAEGECARLEGLRERLKALQGA